MKKLLILLGITWAQTSFAQEFSFPMYFEDAKGNKDTLIFGYDENATDGIDSQFEEVDIKNKEFNTTFEVRTADNYELHYANTVSLSKKQICKKNCSTTFPYVAAIILNNPIYPVKVSWDSTLFNTSCTSKSLITDWNPGGWFDATSGNENPPFYLLTIDSAIFNYTSTYVDIYNSTYDVLYFTIASEFFMTSVGETAMFTSFTIVNNNLIVSNNLGEIKRVTVYTVLGEEQLRTNINTLSINALPQGIYFVSIDTGKKCFTSKFIKQ